MRIVFLALLLTVSQACQAAEVKFLTTGAFKPVVSVLVPLFEAATGNKVVLENDTAGRLLKRIQDGATFDLVVLTPGAVDELIKGGKVAAGSRSDLAKVGIGVAVKAGAAHPDIATSAAFKALLLNAKSVAYIDPKAGGSSGVYLAGLFERLGIADAIAKKAVLVPGGLVAEKVVSGEAEIGIHQISEILAVKGAELAGPLPPDVQNFTIYSAGLGAAAREPAAAQALLQFLAGPEAAKVLKDRGLLPAAQ